MNEYMPQDKPESVWWINTPEQLGRIERIKKWLFEIANKEMPRPIVAIPFSTSIPVEDIESIADDRLKESLRMQLGNVKNNDGVITIPVATVATREFRRSWSVPRKTVESLPPQTYTAKP